MTGGPTLLRFTLRYANNWSGAFLSFIDRPISACASAKGCSKRWARIVTHALYCRFQMLSQSGHQRAVIPLVTFALVIVATCLITAKCSVIWLRQHLNKAMFASN